MKNPSQAKGKSASKRRPVKAQTKLAQTGKRPSVAAGPLADHPTMKFVLRGIGSSMEPEVFEGDRAVVSKRDDMSPCAGELVVGCLKTGEMIFGAHDQVKPGRSRIFHVNAPAQTYADRAFKWLYPVDHIEMMSPADPLKIRAWKTLELNVP